MSFSNYAENAALNWLLNTSAVTRPTAWYVAVHTADPGEDGVDGELGATDDASFVRKEITFGTSTTGVAPSTLGVAWTPTAGSFEVTHVSVWDALTGGNCLISGALVVPRTVTNANPFAIVAGDLIAALD